MPPDDPIMNADQVAQRLALHAEELRSLRVQSLALFGSMVRGDARQDSDVDLLVTFDEMPGFIGYAGVRDRLQEILGRRVDLVMPSGLKAGHRDVVLREARRVL
jgi:uncharacterized protein